MSSYAQQQREVSSSAYFYSYTVGITLMISNTSYTNVDNIYAGTLQGYGNHTIHFSDYCKLLQYIRHTCIEFEPDHRGSTNRQ